MVPQRPSAKMPSWMPEWPISPLPAAASVTVGDDSAKSCTRFMPGSGSSPVCHETPRFQFRLRTLMIVVTLLFVVGGDRDHELRGVKVNHEGRRLIIKKFADPDEPVKT